MPPNSSTHDKTNLRLAGHNGLFIALGGGAARGLAHLGILKVLEEEKIPIAGICGTSMGSIVGACYALHPDSDAVIRDFRNHINSSHFVHVRFAYLRKVRRQKDDSKGKKTTLRQRLSEGLMLGRSYITGAIISYEEYLNEIASLVPNRTFKNTKMPFFATGLDLTNTREVVFDAGFLRSAVMASAAIPGVFPPVCSGKTIYVDGGWMNRIPVNPLLAFGARKVLAVDVSDDPAPDINTRRGSSLLSEANKAAQIRLAELQCERAQAIWRPPVQGLHWADFSQLEQAVSIGEAYARERIDQIKQLMDEEESKPEQLNRWQRFLIKLARLPQPKVLEKPVTFDVRPIWDVGPAEET
ncbi:MAG: patatin-like phospholipase family protein [Acidobacteriota bacterium]|nr:patatin-like phospholipase family protein [Acidobacteriota bacterium]